METAAPQAWIGILTGPFGGLVAVLLVGAAVIAGRLRLEREIQAQARAYETEIAALKAERDEFRRRWEKWESLSLQLMQASSRAVTLAAAVSTAPRDPA